MSAAAIARAFATLAVIAMLVAFASRAMAAGQVTEAHAGTRSGTHYEASPQPYAAPAASATSVAGGATQGSAAAPAVISSDSGSAPREPGAGVEIISGGSSSAGAAKVGRLPVLQ